MPTWAKPAVEPYRDSVLQRVHMLETIQAQLVSIVDLHNRAISSTRQIVSNILSKYATEEYNALSSQNNTEIAIDPNLSVQIITAGSTNPNPQTLNIKRRTALTAALRLATIRVANYRHENPCSLPLVINADNYAVGTDSSLIDGVIRRVNQLLADDLLQQVIWIAREELPKPSI